MEKQDYSNALGYIVSIMQQLDANHKNMLTTVLQVVRDAGYEDGYSDGIDFQSSADNKS